MSTSKDGGPEKSRQQRWQEYMRVPSVNATRHAPTAAERDKAMLGRDTPWPIELLLKALVIAETQLRTGGRDFDGWESIQTAAQVAQKRLSAAKEAT